MTWHLYMWCVSHHLLRAHYLINMPLSTKYNSKTPRKLKMSSVPRHVQNFDIPTLKESFHSELSLSIFNEGKLPSSYEGDIIADCWFPDRILPVVPNAKLLNVLTGPDGQPLYDSLTKQWDRRYLPPMLHKMENQHRLGPGQEERDLSMFMSAIMDALIRHHDDGCSSVTPVLSETSDPCCSSPLNTNTSTLAQSTPISPSKHGKSVPATTSIPNLSSPLPANALTRSSTPGVSTPGISTPSVFTPSVSPPLSPSSDSHAESSTSMSRPLSLNPAITPANVTSGPDTAALTSPSFSLASSLQSDHGASTSWSSHRAKYEFPPRLWSSAAATQSLPGDSSLKPDSMLVRQPADGVTRPPGWEDMLMTAELTSRQQNLNLSVQIESKALAMFDTQPN